VIKIAMALELELVLTRLRLQVGPGPRCFFGHLYGNYMKLLGETAT